MLCVGKRNPKEKTQKNNGVIVNKNDSCIGNTKIHIILLFQAKLDEIGDKIIRN
jgi:hypothetical protein